MLKRIFVTILVFTVSIGLCGCLNKIVYIFDPIDEEDAAAQIEKLFVDLLDAVNENQTEVFDTYFANHVLTLHDFEKGRNYLFETYKGELIDIEHSVGSSGESIEPGEHYWYQSVYFDIITSENEYMACVEFYTKYKSENPEEPYKIRKIKLVEKQNFENSGKYTDCGLRYGIYYPGWVNGLV